MPVRLFVGNLPFDTTEADLREFFSSVAPLTHVHIAMDRETGRPRGFAFVEFATSEKADEAIQRFNNQPFKDRPLVINEARARDATAGPRPPSGPRPPHAPRASFGQSSWSPEPEGEQADQRPRRFAGGPAAQRKKKEKQDRAPKPKAVVPEKRIGRFMNEELEQYYSGGEELEDFPGDDIARKADEPENEE